jgi:hypothetical protein
VKGAAPGYSAARRHVNDFSRSVPDFRFPVASGRTAIAANKPLQWPKSALGDIPGPRRCCAIAITLTLRFDHVRRFGRAALDLQK